MELLPWHQRSTTTMNALEPMVDTAGKGDEPYKLRSLQSSSAAEASLSNAQTMPMPVVDKSREDTLIKVVKYLACLLGDK